MDPIAARAVYIKKEASEDPRSMARIDRVLPFVDCATRPTVIRRASLTISQTATSAKRGRGGTTDMNRRPRPPMGPHHDRSVHHR